MATKPTPIEAAQARIDELLALEHDLTTRLFALRRELSSAAITPAAIGATVDSIAASIQQKAILSAQAELTDLAIDQTREHRRAAIHALYAAEADDLRSVVADERRALEDHEARTAALVAELLEHEGATYRPVQPGHGYFLPAQIRGDQLRVQVEAREREVRAIEQRTITEHGTLTGASVDDLIEAIKALPATTIAPRLDHVADWCVTRALPWGATYRLDWNHGALTGSTRILLPVPDRSRRRLRCVVACAGQYHGNPYEHYPGQLVGGDSEYLDWLLKTARNAYLEEIEVVAAA
jgi:hypothetical protein